MAVLLAVVVFSVLFLNLIADTLRQRLHPADEDSVEAAAVELQLTFAYQNPQWNAQIARTVRDFEAENPEIHINYEPDYENRVYEDGLTRKIARNELGDIIQLKTPEPYVAGGYLTPLPAEMADQVSYSYTKDDQVWAIGAIETTSGILYNKKIFAAYGLREPETFSDFLEICQTLKENGIVPIGVAGNDLWHMEYWVNHFFRADVLSSDENWLEKCREGSVLWTDEEPVQMLSHLKQLFSSGYVNEDWLSMRDTSLTYLLQKGDVAMIFTGPWTIKSVEENAGWEAGWFVVPDEQGQTYAANNQDTYWVLSKECGEDPEKYAAAIRFLDYFYSTENYTLVCEGTMTYPVNQLKPVEENMDELRKDVLDSYMKSTEQMTSYIGDSNCPQNFESDCLTLIETYLDTGIDAEEAARQIQAAWDNRRRMEEIE